MKQIGNNYDSGRGIISHFSNNTEKFNYDSERGAIVSQFSNNTKKFKKINKILDKVVNSITELQNKKIKIEDYKKILKLIKRNSCTQKINHYPSPPTVDRTNQNNGSNSRMIQGILTRIANIKNNLLLLNNLGYSKNYHYFRK